MSKRYMGNETITSRSQLIRYLQDNYIDGAGNNVTETTATKLVANADEEKIDKAITVYRSNVEYVGDEIIKDADAPFTWVEAEEEDYEEEEEDDD